MVAELDKVFTVAVSTGEEGPVNLLFTSMNRGTEITNLETMKQIVADPEFKKIMASGAVLVALKDGESPQLLATNDITDYALALMETAEASDHVLIYSPESGIHQVNLRENYYSCLRPERTLIGCVECGKNGSNNKDCKIKQLTYRYYAHEGEGWTPTNVTENFKSRKSKIGGFTYVSPRLTAHREFAKMFRPIGEHDFSFVRMRSDMVVRGLRERKRKKEFFKDACSVCLVREKCSRASLHSRGGLWCKGNYPINEKTAVNTVLANIKIPFTNTEIATLLAHSGELDKRYYGRKHWATFDVVDNRLVFAIKYKRTTQTVEIFTSYKKAIAFLSQRNEPHPWIINYFNKTRLTNKQKAVLVELATHDCSPRRTCGWGGSYSYPVIGIQFTNKYGNGGFSQYFVASRGRDLTWLTTDIANFNDIFSNYSDLTYLDKVTHPLGRGYW